MGARSGAPDRALTAEPDSPADLPARDRKASLVRAFRNGKENRITLAAAGVAFYWFLAVFPLLIAAIAIMSLAHIGQSFMDTATSGIQQTLPEGAAQVLTTALSNASSRASGGVVAAGIAILLALWSSSTGMAALQNALDLAYEVPEPRPFVRRRAVGLVLTLVALVVGGIATAMLVFGKPVVGAIEDLVPFEGAFAVAWTIARWVVAVLAVMALFAVFYYLGPNRPRPSWKWVSPGGIVATVIWLAASVGFSLYVSNFGGSYARTYGSLAGVIILLLWLFLSALALLFGAEFNGELERQAEAEQAQPTSEIRSVPA